MSKALFQNYANRLSDIKQNLNIPFNGTSHVILGDTNAQTLAQARHHLSQAITLLNEIN